MKAFSIKELRKISKKELIKKHDDKAKNTIVGINYFLDELHRRNLENHTKSMRYMTVVITATTILNLLILAISIFGNIPS